MEAKRNPEYLTAVWDAVTEFRAALVEFLKLHEVNEFFGRGLMPAVMPKEKAKPAEIARLQAEVAKAAGRAGAATGLTGCFIMVQGAGQIEPIAAWASRTQPKPLLESGDVLNARRPIR